MQRTIFVTTALPYANGELHIGHIMEYIQADIWVRSMRMSKHTVYFIGADDAHGAPIMLKAEKEGITPEELVKRYTTNRQQYFKGFYISFDHWDTTLSKENKDLSCKFYKELKKQGLIYSKFIDQFYDPMKDMFLSDRYIRGTCPECNANDQYGDSCEKCGSVYSPMDLINPYSSLTGEKPIIKSSEHFFFKLSDPKCVNFLETWVHGKNRHGQLHLQEEVSSKIKEWLNIVDNKILIKDWDISRDAPYFGIEIPDTKDKFFYVWLDAPIGYLSSFKIYCEKNNINFDEIIKPDSNIEQIHFIGKDITYFHALFWPAMTNFAMYKVPDRLNVHGFITINNEKMSKSRGTGLSPLKYLNIGMNPEWLRYYLATKLNGTIADIDFNKKDFINRINSDLVGKFANLASRSSKFINEYFQGILYYDDNTKLSLQNEIINFIEKIKLLFENHNYSKSLREIMSFNDSANKDFDKAKPWLIAKEINFNQFLKNQLHLTCSIALAKFRAISIALSPVLPNISANIAKNVFGNKNEFIWQDAHILPYKINHFKHLINRIDEKIMEKLFDSNDTSDQKNHNDVNIINNNYITIEDVAKIDMRVAKIIDCHEIINSEKMLSFTLDIGQNKYITVFSGIKNSYDPESLIGKFTIVIVNLQPRKMRFGISEGMILAASDSNDKNDKIYLLEPHNGAYAGMKIK
ncbi:Methionine--tRNA ligase [Candidatus Kinetoplastibacterium sorsogonicusi]|uniref:Methionine--tRNA ligase n=1 Tax=Candidatus Kinetoplastidibacterium kentomonadis TaxID=1576550 RepID=A0A3S7J981_9PROT|nr:methionine--tRNA ligase [Candidatus Kinetoplastibacterium sorsogonicusi]AWD32226.1 Methionine--tRNA ligase [Candidatus Kinetoplastibacterium sorsogonicusi]